MADSDSFTDGNRPVQIPVLPYPEGAGTESLIFYVQGPVNWQFDDRSGEYLPVRNQVAGGKSILFLTEEAGEALTLSAAEQPMAEPDMVVTDYDDLRLWEEENLNLLESGNRWFTSVVPGGGTFAKSFTFPDRLPEEPGKITVCAAARSFLYTDAAVSLNGSQAGRMTFNPVGGTSGSDYASLDSLGVRAIVPGLDLTVAVKYSGGSTDLCWMDYVALQVRCHLRYSGTPLIFRDSRSTGTGKIAEFRIDGGKQGLLLWDLSDLQSPRQITTLLTGSQLRFKSETDRLKNFVLFDPAMQYPGVTVAGSVKHSDIFSVDVPELLILTAGQLAGQAERLAVYHRQADGMRVLVVPVESVFDEFSGGYRDIVALKNYIRYLFNKGGQAGNRSLKYLLLFGKGTCDPVREAGENNPNLVPAFQSENSLNAINSYVSDDIFGTFRDPYDAGSGYLQLGIGRIPAVSPEEAAVAVDKITGYHGAQSFGEWRTNIALIGDDEDGNMHVADSEALAAVLNQQHPEYGISRIYLDAYRQEKNPEERYPDVNKAINRSMQSGNLIVNYIGHASEDGLAHEKILTIPEIGTMTNLHRLPLFVTATCEFSRWDMVMKRSAGEHLLFHPAGGAIALLSATRLVYAASNFALNRSFFSHLFDRDEAGHHLRLGDLVRLVKNENSGSLNALKFSLLGDPALRLNYTGYRCRDTEINRLSPDQFEGTVSPGSLVTVSGEIQDEGGRKMDISGGELSVTVYDQPVTKNTLGNGGQPPFAYLDRQNVLYKGTAKVQNGTYRYSFIVPKDVSFDTGSGLIRTYFTNGETDASGAFTPIRFNGPMINGLSDRLGPDIRIYLEDEKFTNGSRVSQKPLLLAYLADDSGINTSGLGIGHDLTLEVDGKASELLIVNDYYTADPGTWKSGKVMFPLSDLSPGSHVLKLKAWDTANNSSTATIRFVVEKELKINSVVNFPNPFSGRTEFVVDQNCYNEFFRVELEIADLSGRIISAGRYSLGSSGYRLNGLFWEPGSSSGPLPDGIYFYRISLESPDGARTSKGGKLLLKN